mmetsp:Transcript_54162/g.60560  ORF Transcript_54162/g.60560 Transcript_54162/m.60560 type:complete len:673 (-) Transcript_54162:109-2127(-)
MGRKRNTNNNDRSSRNKNRKSKGKSNLERKLLLNYLQSYQDLYYSTLSAETNDKPNSHPMKIGEVCLPRLDDNTILEQPFLALPQELLPYQRAMVHDLCVDNLKLFHCGVDGENEGERYVVISIFSDGLTHLTSLNDIDNCCLPVLQAGKYKPWIMKNNIDQILKINEGKNMIHRMIDQPGRCLRDGHDFVDLLKMKDENLSTITAPKQDDTTCLLVDSLALMQQCIKELEENKPTEIAFDLECYNKQKDQQITCLIQLATNDGREYIIDVLGDNGKVWDMVGSLTIFADKNVVKIGHGICGLDIQSLQRDFGIFVVNAFDTYEAAITLRLKEKGLAKLCAHYGLSNSELYKSLKSKYQTTNWAKRPLTNPMILYGRYDVHYLITLWRLMVRDLIKSDVEDDTMDNGLKEVGNNLEPPMALSSVLGDDIMRILNEEDGIIENDYDVPSGTNGSTTQVISNEEESVVSEITRSTFHAKELRMNPRLMQVISKSQDHCLKFWNIKPQSYLENKQFLFLATQCKKDGNQLSKSQLDLYAKLASWREDVAKKEESLPGVVFSLDFLVRVAVVRPVNEFGLRRIRYDIPHVLLKYNDRRYMKVMLELVRKSLIADNIDKCKVYPTFKDFKEQIALKHMSLQENRHSRKIANWVLWAATSAAISLVVCISINRIKWRR